MSIVMSLLGGAWGFIKRMFEVAARHPWQAALIVALCLSVWLWMGKRSALDSLAKEQSAHIATKVSYANAQKVAADINKKQVEHIKSQYDAIAERSESEYEIRLADNRAALREWMRSKAAKGAAQGTGTGSAATVPGEAMPDATEAFVPVSDLEIAADNYSQLVSLIEWAKLVGKVKVND